MAQGKRSARTGSPEGGTGPTLQVLIVSANRLFGDGLVCLLGHDESIDVIDIAPGLANAVEVLRDFRADVALVDCCRDDGVNIVRGITVERPDTKVLAIGVGEIEQPLVDLIEAGALGYIPSDATLAEAICALHQAGSGEAVCSPRVTAAVIRRLGSQTAGGALRTHLTRRELEVLMLMDEGLSNKEIARMLTLEVATVKNHVHSILQKLHLRRRGQAAAWLRLHRAQD